MSDPGGLSAAALTEIKQILSKTLKSKPKAMIYFFGSRARGNYRKYSDLDLWIEANPPLSQREITNLLETFEESDLSQKIDIVTPEICLPEYLNSIQKEKVLWFKTYKSMLSS